MISQLLNQDFLLAAAESTRRGLLQAGEDLARRADVGPLEGLSRVQVEEVARELARVLDAATLDRAEPGAPAPKDDVVCMPREPVLAILQTVLEEVTAEQRPDRITEGAPADERRSGAVPLLSERRLSGLELPAGDDGRRAWGRFEVTDPLFLSDPRWVLSGVVIAYHKFKNDRAAFGGLPDVPVEIADDARILLVGDWGSGIPRARKVAARMREQLDAGAAAGRQQHVVHLGDVYYTGSAREYEQNFLAHWPVRRGEDVGSFNLAGNHDMYQGGHAYYDLCLADARFARQEGRSVFSLRSGSWQFLGLDSSYEDKALYGGQAEWVQEQLHANPGHRTALLSHHQLFSAYEDGADRMGEQLGPVLGTGRVDAWFWAHEHRCLTYGAHRGVGFATCLGHGGIPEYLVRRDPEEATAPLRYSYRREFGEGMEPWNTFGFAVLELDGPDLRVLYVDEDGNRHHEEHLRA